MIFFLKKVFSVVFVVFIVQLVLIIGTLAIERTYNFKISSDINKLVIGHSMTECAINDSLYKGSLNVSHAGTQLNYSYVKLKKILEFNPQIDTVILGVKPDDIEGVEKEIDLGANIYEKIPKYLFLFSSEDLIPYLLTPSFYGAICSIPFDFIMNFPVLNSSRFKVTNYGIGRFRHNYGAHLDTSTFVSSGYDLHSNFKLDLSAYTYLFKIKKLCSNHHVELICLNPPMYESLGNPHFQSWMVNHRFNYKDASAFDLKSTDFYDYEHLNPQGASKFSLALDSLLTK